GAVLDADLSGHGDRAVRAAGRLAASEGPLMSALPAATESTLPAATTRRKPVIAIVLFLALAAVPVAVSFGLPPHWMTLVTRAMIFAIAALSLDLILGIGGLVSF